MSIGFFAFRRSFGPGKALLAGLATALLFALLVPAGALARSFAPDVQVSVDPNTANQAPQLTQSLTRRPLVLSCDSNNPPATTDCGEQAIKQLSFKLPRSWRVNGEALVEPCDLPPSNPVQDDSLTPIDPSLCSPSGQVGTVDANLQIKICAGICGLGLDPLTVTVGASGKVYYVNSFQYYDNPELGNRQDWAQKAFADGDTRGNSLPVVVAIQIDALGLLGPPPYESLDIFPPFYLASYLSRDSFRIQNDLTPDAELLGPGSAWFNTAILQSMNLTLNPNKTEAAGLFRTPPVDACSGDQVWDYSATSFADSVAGPPPANPADQLDAEQAYPDEGMLQTTTPALTGCDSQPDPFDSLKVSKVESTTTDAGANPALTLTMTRASGDAFLKGLKMTLPEGMIGSPFATTELCSDEQAQQGQCPAGSKVGSASTEVSVFETRQITIDGDVYQAPTTGSELARFLTVLRTPPIGDEQIAVLPANMYMLPGVKGIVAEVPSMPTEFDVRKVVFTFDGSTGAANKHPLLINPTSCNPGDIKVDFTSEMDQTYTATAPYQTTNCDKLPFDPSFDVALSCSGPHCLPGISMTIAQPYGDAAMSGSKVTIPGSYVLNLDSQVKPCSLADQAAETCPADSVMGNAVIESPLAIEPLQGEIFLAEQAEGDSDVFRRIHIRVTGLIDMSLDADLKSNPDGGFDTVISGIPQVPITKMQLNLNGGENALVYAPYECGGHEFKAEFASHAGQTASKSSTPEISGEDCAPRLSASVSPRKAGAKSKLTLNVRPNQGAALKSAKFDLGSLKVRGLGRSRSSRQVGKLTLTPKSGKRGTSSLVTKGGRKITSKPGKGSRGALSTSKTKLSLGSHSLSVKGLPDEVLSELNLVFNSKRTRALRNPKKCGKVKIVGKFVDTKGRTYETATKARIGCATHRR